MTASERAVSIFDIADFSLLDMLRCSKGLRQAASHTHVFDAAATAVTGYLYSQFADPATKQPQCALVRLYNTRRYGDLDPSLQNFARNKLGGMPLGDDTRVLTLVATTGLKPEWCDPDRSLAHKAIPLPSVEIVEQAPMIAALIKALGVEIADLVTPSVSLMRDSEGKTYNVFFVERALGSPVIPAQTEFVKPYGIKSVIGFGGLLPTGELFALVMFSRVSVPAESAARFRSVALDVKAILHQLSLSEATSRERLTSRFTESVEG